MVQHCLGNEHFSYCETMKCFYLGERPGKLEDYIVDSVDEEQDAKYVIETIDDCRIVNILNKFYLMILIFTLLSLNFKNEDGKSEYDVVFKSDPKHIYTTTGSCISSYTMKCRARRAAKLTGKPKSKQRPYINGKFIIDPDWKKGDVYDKAKSKRSNNLKSKRTNNLRSTLITKASIKKVQKK